MDLEYVVVATPIMALTNKNKYKTYNDTRYAKPKTQGFNHMDQPAQQLQDHNQVVDLTGEDQDKPVQGASDQSHPPPAQRKKRTASQPQTSLLDSAVQNPPLTWMNASSPPKGRGTQYSRLKSAPGRLDQDSTT